MKKLVLFHGPGCADGFVASWCAWRALGDTAEYVPVQYGQEPPEVDGRELYVLDFSYKRPMMMYLISRAKATVVIDHHKTAEEELYGLEHLITGSHARLPEIVFDMNKSGAMLAWEYFHPGEEAPWLVKMIQDRDLWKFDLPDSREVSAWFASVPWTYELCDSLYPEPAGKIEDSIIDQGEAILRYQRQQIESAIKHAREVTIGGHLVPAINCTHLTSEIVGRLAAGKPFAAGFFFRGDGKVCWSLRSDENGLDVSEIARSLGGGGHPRASGFELDDARFIDEG